MIYLPEKLRDNIYIDPLKEQYDLAEYINEKALFAYGYVIYSKNYVYNWDLTIKCDYHFFILYQYADRIFKPKNKQHLEHLLYDLQIVPDINTATQETFILPFYKNIVLRVETRDQVLLIYNNVQELIRMKLKRKYLLNDAFDIIKSLINIKKPDFKDYLNQWLTVIKARILLYKL